MCRCLTLHRLGESESQRERPSAAAAVMAEADRRLRRALMGLSDYELQQLEKVREHKERELRRSPRRLVPESVKDKGREWYDKALKTPGAAKIKDGGAAALKAAAEGAGKFMTRTGQRGLRRREFRHLRESAHHRPVRAVRRAGPGMRRPRANNSTSLTGTPSSSASQIAGTSRTRQTPLVGTCVVGPHGCRGPSSVKQRVGLGIGRPIPVEGPASGS
jgi:hypothetical protein